MKKWFLLPDRELFEIESVLAGKVAKAFDFAPISFYQAIAAERRWDGVPHVTGLLNGTRQSVFCEYMDYAVDVENSVWAITGLTGHRNLERVENNEFSNREEKLVALGIQGTSDHTEEHDGVLCLVDSKFYGSYGVASKLGVYEAGRKQRVDKNGNPEYYSKAGKWGKAGDPKTDPVYKYDLAKGDNFDLIRQVNIYKILKEEQPGARKIGMLKAFIIPRDGGTQSARQRGVLKNLYFIKLPIEDETEVREFIVEQRDKLIKAMTDFAFLAELPDKSQVAVVEAMKKSGLEIPPPCNNRECWNGRRCQDFCPVKEACRAMGDVAYLTGHYEERELEDF